MTVLPDGRAVVAVRAFGRNRLMVVQQGKKVAIFGTAENGEEVRVKLRDREASTTAKGGRWLVRLDPLEAGGPFEMTVAGSNTITLKDVYVGEVWVASGQSNMEWPVRVNADAEATIRNSKNPLLRLFTVADLDIPYCV